jgi:hypothetical protein
MVDKASIWSFARAFREHRFAAMSGGFSVPFTAAAVWMHEQAQTPLQGGGMGPFTEMEYWLLASHHRRNDQHDGGNTGDDDGDPNPVEVIELSLFLHGARYAPRCRRNSLREIKSVATATVF